MSFYHGAAEQAERRTSIIKYLEATLVEPVQGATSWGFSDLPVIKDSPVPEQTKFRTHTLADQSSLLRWMLFVLDLYFFISLLVTSMSI